LEQFDEVARGVLQQNLSPTGAADDLTAEGQSSCAQSLDLLGDVVDD
jgi:hypothetical protein